MDNIIEEFCKENKLRWDTEPSGDDTLYFIHLGSLTLGIQAETDYVYQVWVQEKEEIVKELEDVEWNDLTKAHIQENIDIVKELNSDIAYVESQVEKLKAFVEKSELENYLSRYIVDEFDN